MKPRSRLQLSLCCLGSLLLGSTALAQPDPRTVVVRPSAAANVRAPATAKRYWAD